MRCILCQSPLIPKSSWIVECSGCKASFGGIYHQTKEDEERGQILIGINTYKEKQIPKFVGRITADYEVTMQVRNKVYN